MSLESGHHQVTVFGAESTVTSPMKLMRDMVSDFVASRQLASMLAFRDLKAQYRQSMLGWFWLLIPPLVWTVGLTVLRKNNLADLGRTELHYPAYVLIGMALWQTFTNCLQSPIRAFQMNKGILTKVRFPREAIVLADVIKISVDACVYLVLVIAALLYYRIPLSPSLLLLPFAVLVLMMLGTVGGLLLAPVGLLYRDIGNLIPYFIWGGMVITPVIAPMPEASNDGIFATVVRMNPVTPVLVTARELAAGQALTQLPQFAIVAVVTVFCAVIAMTILRAAMPLVVERWSS